MRVLDSLLGRSRQASREKTRRLLEVEMLESRDLLTANAVLAGTVLVVNGGPFNDNITVTRDVSTNQLVVLDYGTEVARFDSAAVTNIVVNAGAGEDKVLIDSPVTQNAILNGDGGLQRFQLGGDVLIYRGQGTAIINAGPGNSQLLGGPNNDILNGGAGNDILSGGPGSDLLTGGPGRDRFFGHRLTDTITDPTPFDQDFRITPLRDLLFDPFLGLPPSPTVVITAQEVNTVLQRATAA